MPGNLEGIDLIRVAECGAASRLAAPVTGHPILVALATVSSFKKIQKIFLKNSHLERLNIAVLVITHVK